MTYTERYNKDIKRKLRAEGLSENGLLPDEERTYKYLSDRLFSPGNKEGWTRKETDAMMGRYGELGRLGVARMAKIRIPLLIERGKEVFDIKTADEADWETTVAEHTHGIYGGRDLEAALDIYELARDGQADVAKEEFDRQNHSGNSAAAVIRLLEQYGCDFCVKLK